jgi:Protein of unknown function (DUF3102)
MTEKMPAADADVALSDDTETNAGGIAPFGPNDDNPKSDLCGKVVLETALQTSDAAIRRRGRGRPGGPRLKILLTQNFPYGATAETLVGAGFKGDLSAAVKRRDVRQLEDGRYICIASSTTPEAAPATGSGPLLSSPTPLPPALVSDVLLFEGLPEIPPLHELTDDEYLDRAEGEIRGYSRNVVQNIVAIGRKLVEIKDRVGHGNYEGFVRQRLGFSPSTALRFVQSYEAVKSVTVTDLESLQIDAKALYLLARPSTPEEVRTEALERAATGGISLKEVQQLIANAQTEAERKTREAADRQVAEKLAAVERANEAAAIKAAEQNAALTEQIRQSETKIAQAGQQIAELQAAAATVAQSVRAEIEAQYQDKVVTARDDLEANVEATVKRFTGPLEREIEVLTQERDDAKTELASVRKQQADAIRAAAENAAVEAQEPLPQPVDTKLYCRSLDAGLAIAHSAKEIRLSAAECIAIEKEVATRLQRGPDIARDTLEKIAAAIRHLQPWFDSFLELFAYEISKEISSPSASPIPSGNDSDGLPTTNKTRAL